MKKWLKFVISGILIVGFIIFIIASLWIGSDVRKYCRDAKKVYEGDCVTVLSEMVDDKSMPPIYRNNAIWALGQLGDPKALTYLNKYYTGIIPEKEDPNKVLSQYEMSKAMKLMQGGINLPALVWRHNIK